jgi:protein-disulfide isomerase
MSAKKKQPDRGNMKLFYAVLVGIAIVGIASILYARSRTGQEAATAPIDIGAVTDASTLLQRARGVQLGEENAPVRILVFSDFQCPGCQSWASRIEPTLKAEFITTGKVRLTYYDFPLTQIHDHAFLAARAARCAGDQGKFWELHDRLFANQFQWGMNKTPPPIKDFVRYATEAGVEPTAFESCLNSDKHADVVTANHQLGETLRVGGTPSVFINNRMMQGNSWGDYGAVKAAIEAAGGV